MDTKTSPGPEAHWRAALQEGRILLQRDPADGSAYFPPRFVGPNGQALEWIEANGRGTVYSTTTIYPRPPKEPYNVVLVELEEGARMMSRVDCIDAEDLAIGTPVEARIVQSAGEPLVVFHPA